MKEIYEHDRQLLEEAKAETPRGVDGSFVEDELAKNLAKRVLIDVGKEQFNKAKSIIERFKRPGTTIPNGQLLLPGFNWAYDYEPHRMVGDATGKIIENFRAPPAFKQAEVARAQENVEHAVEHLRRKTAESALFNLWAIDQAVAGRPVLDLQWGICVEEKNLRRSNPDLMTP